MTEWDEGNAMVSAQKVVYDIMHGNKQVVLVDMRSPEQYQRFSLPGAINIQPAEILGRSYRDFFRNDPRQKVFLSDGSALAAQGWHMARRAGFDNVYFLEGGLNGVFEMVFTDRAEEDYNNYMYSFSKRFANEARQFFSEGGAKEEQSPRQVPVQTIIEIKTPTVAGGC